MIKFDCRCQPIAVLATSLFIMLSGLMIKAQSPLAQLEGRMEMWNGNDRSSVYIGLEAGKNAETNPNMLNTVVGSEAGRSILSGIYNSFYGGQAGNANTSGTANSYFGTFAGLVNTIGQGNSFFGQGAGFDNTSGSDNCFIGVFSGRFNREGARNVFIGHSAGGIIGNRNICIGRSAGPSLTPSLLHASNRLYIDVNRTNQPLIYGEFDNRLIRINGNLNVTGDISGTFNRNSDAHLKEQVCDIDQNSILDKVNSIEILEWQYKGSNERHIGPMAQEFYAAFGLGKGETTIATIDADGVALAAIQALYARTENRAKMAESRMSRLEEEVAELRRILRSIDKGEIGCSNS